MGIPRATGKTKEHHEDGTLLHSRGFLERSEVVNRKGLGGQSCVFLRINEHFIEVDGASKPRYV